MRNCLENKFLSLGFGVPIKMSIQDSLNEEERVLSESLTYAAVEVACHCVHDSIPWNAHTGFRFYI